MDRGVANPEYVSLVWLSQPAFSLGAKGDTVLLPTPHFSSLSWVSELHCMTQKSQTTK